MKYMVMMFGSAEEMLDTQAPDWVSDMITFMRDLDRELTESGEMVTNEGLVDGSQATLVRRSDDGFTGLAARMTTSRQERDYLTLRAARL